MTLLFSPIELAGKTLKNRIVIPFDGSHRDFKHVIYHELVHAFINDCVYGGSLKSMMSNSILSPSLM